MAISSSLRTLRYLWSSLSLKIRIFIDKSVQLAGPLYVILAVTLISGIIYLFFSTILPSIHSLSSLRGLSHAMISIWLIFNVFFNYFYCIKTDPGSPSGFIVDVEHDPMSLNGRQEASGTTIRWCKTCKRVKPPMTHHCHICRRCILKMDHHCPWMHNCIGFFNYRFFFLFLFYLWVGCAYTTYMASIPLQKSDEDEENTQILFAFVLAIAVFFSLTGLFWFHVYLVLSAQTTIDFYAYRRRRHLAMLEARQRGEKFIAPSLSNVYDMGKIRNLRTLFDRGGAYWWLVMFLPHNLPPKGDGAHFLQRQANDFRSTSDRESLMLEHSSFEIDAEGTQDIVLRN